MTVCRAAVSVSSTVESWDSPSHVPSNFPSNEPPWFERCCFLGGTRKMSIIGACESTWEILLQMCLFAILRFAWSTDFAARNDQIFSCKASTGTESWKMTHWQPITIQIQEWFSSSETRAPCGRKAFSGWLRGGMGDLVVGRQHQVLCSWNRCAHVPAVSDKVPAGSICVLAQQSLGWWAQVPCS